MPTLKCPQKPKKKPTEKLLNWDAHYVGIKAMKELQRNSITLEEVAFEAALLLSRYAPITIEDQIPVFTEWVENALKQSMLLQKNNYLKRHWG
jgi:hypothetical protein